MKQKDCSVSGFEGHVVFCDPLNLEQVFAIEEAQESADKIEPSKFLTKVTEMQAKLEALKKGEQPPEFPEGFGVSWTSKTDGAFLPAILLCVKEWHLANVPEHPTVETFPMTPRGKSSELVNWLWDEIAKIYKGETEIPNASSPTPTTTQ